MALELKNRHTSSAISSTLIGSSGIVVSSISLATLILAAGCDRGSQDPAAQVVANANVQASPVDAPGPADNSSSSASAEGRLSKYVGKHPSDVVDGTRFLDEPAVRIAVAAAVPAGEVRDFVFNYSGPDAPIVAKDGRILAWGCERHNCGYHNWSIAIAADGSTADVCFYHNDDDPNGIATWYLPGGKVEKRPGNCPSD